MSSEEFRHRFPARQEHIIGSPKGQATRSGGTSKPLRPIGLCNFLWFLGHGRNCYFPLLTERTQAREPPKSCRSIPEEPSPHISHQQLIKGTIATHELALQQSHATAQDFPDSETEAAF